MTTVPVPNFDDLIKQAMESYGVTQPYAPGDSPSAPITRGELEIILTGLLAGGGVTVTATGGISKTEAQAIAVRSITDFANGEVFRDVVKRLIEDALQPLKAEVAALVAACKEPEPQKHDKPDKKPH
jgi:hypothetical protein